MGANDDGGGGGDPPPADADAMGGWLEEGTYLDWPAESGPHDSAGPHFDQVRTFINPALDASLAASMGVHPSGSAAVKELYGAGSELRGYAIAIKTQDGESGADWWWYEIYDGQTYAASQGASLCTGCHSDGLDFVWTPYPLQ